MLEEKLLDIEVISPKGTLYKEKAKAVSSFNKKGPFDILPFHRNFISLIYNELKITLSEDKEKTFYFENGIIRVKNNKVEAVLEETDKRPYNQ